MLSPEHRKLWLSTTSVGLEQTSEYRIQRGSVETRGQASRAFIDEGQIKLK